MTSRSMNVWRYFFAALALAIMVPLGTLADQHKVIGLSLLAIVCAEALISRAGDATAQSYRSVLFRGLTLGLVTAAIKLVFVDKLMASTFGRVAHARTTGDTAPYYHDIRTLIFATFMAAGIYLLLQLFLDKQRWSRSARAVRHLALFLALNAVFFGGTLISIEIETFGDIMNRLSGGLIDWIGSGACASRAHMTAACRVAAAPDIPVTAALMLAVFFLLSALVDFRRWHLGPAASAYGLAILAVCGAILVGLVVWLEPSFQGEAFWYQRLIPLVPAAAAMGLYALAYSFVLTWSHGHALTKALVNAFVGPETFRQMLKGRLQKTVPGQFASFDDEVKAAVQLAEEEGWVDELVVNARFSHPNHAGLANIARRRGLDVQLPDAAKTAERIKDPEIRADQTPEKQLETIVRKDSTFKDPEVWNRLWAAAMTRVCRIENHLSPLGTGWLVGPDIVLTNHHVVQNMLGSNAPLRARDITCRFDYKVGPDGRTINEGSVFGLRDGNPIIAYTTHSPSDLRDAPDLPRPNQLDFALLRLDRSAGAAPIGGNAEAGAAVRGWISLKSAATAELKREDLLNRIIFVLQHPAGMPIKLEIGIINEVNDNATRVRHNANTEPGSSGSPCFNSDWQPVALHHAGGHSRTINLPYNQAVPVACIVRYLRDLGTIEPFWDLEPPGGSNFKSV